MFVYEWAVISTSLGIFDRWAWLVHRIQTPGFSPFWSFHVVACLYWGYCVVSGLETYDRVRLELTELRLDLRPT